MSVRSLILFPDRGLSQPCEVVQEFGVALKNLLDDLRDTLYAGPGVGLAAPQIGVHRRVSFLDIHRGKKGKAGSSPKERGAYFIVNPVLLSGRGIQTPREGCLSIPDLLANVRRYQAV